MEKIRIIGQNIHRCAYHSQNINVSNVNAALDKLIEINPLYKKVKIDRTWETVSEETDPETWNLLTNPDAEPMSDDTDSKEEMANNSTKDQGPFHPVINGPAGPGDNIYSKNRFVAY